MDNNLDVRWEQRFANYLKALGKLTTAVEIVKLSIKQGSEIGDVEELQREGLIRRFEYTHELAWNVMADYAKWQGYQDIKGSRDAIRYALEKRLIDSKEWMNTINDRNRTSHTYNETTANEIIVDIVKSYYALFVAFATTMNELRSDSCQQKLF